ncbi:MAG: VPLPA-CTERM sorting domain-containing protein [Gammaproteobacteria bacterium]|nr:VPLPA-CTERM sorting domain-containing protein [Gammaproteobacteria bacterium]HXK57553.1 hypothetical protein [Gammaproteobacteria bacterium]
MKTIKIGSLLGILLLIGSASASAALHEFDWTGKTTVSGFVPGSGTDPSDDSDPYTMRFEWLIDGGSSFTIGTPSGAPLTVSGNFTILSLFGAGADKELPVELITGVAALLPVGSRTFPPGMSPLFQAIAGASGNPDPLVEVPLMDAPSLIDSVLNINEILFDGSLLVYSITEVPQQNPPLGTLSGSFALLDQFGNNDGIISRDFVLHATISEVPLPAAFWLMGSALLGLMGISRRRARLLVAGAPVNH